MQPLNPVLTTAVVNEIAHDRRSRGLRTRRFARRNALAPTDATGPRATRADRA